MTRAHHLLLVSTLAACAGGPRDASAPPPTKPPPEPAEPAAAIPAAPTAAETAPDLMQDPPALEGFAVDGQPTAYDATTLFEYIDGAADGFLKFGFRELVAIDYARTSGETSGTLTVDIYRHADAYNGYGIYRQEQFDGSRDPDIGAGSTYKPGALVFFKGPYYVKISGFDLGEADAATLGRVARSLADLLPGGTAPPRPTACFPTSGLVPDSVRYINEAFLGHGFLNAVFVAEYEIGGAKSRLFLLEAPDVVGARDVLARYTGLARKKGKPVEESNRRARFRDPYLGSTEPVTLEVRGRYLLGAFTRDAAVAARQLEALASGLREHALLR